MTPKIGDIYEIADYGKYPPRIFFTRVEEAEGLILGPMRRRTMIDAHGRTMYTAEAKVIQVNPQAVIVGDADDFEGTPVL